MFWRQLSQFYSFFLQMPPHMDAQPALPSQRLQFIDFAKWQQQTDTQAALNQHLKYWVSELSGVSLPVLELPEDKPRPPVQSFKVYPCTNRLSSHCSACCFQGERLEFRVDSSVAKELQQISSAAGATAFTTMLAAFQVLLCKSSRQDSVVVGMPYHGRESSDFDEMIGFFVNTLAFYSEIPWEKTFGGFVRDTQPRMEQALMHGQASTRILWPAWSSCAGR